MQTSWNFFYLLGKLPYIFALIVIGYIFVKVLKAFWERCFSYGEGSVLKQAYNFFDPYHQGIFCYKYKWYSILLLIGAIYLLCKIYIPPEMIPGKCGIYPAQSILSNHITYFINYILHEMLGHNVFCQISSYWFCTLSGDLTQVLVPAAIYLFSLQLRGGLLFTPVIFYWLSCAVYSAGIYASDAAASQLCLTSSDMVTDHAAGTVKGDWYYILGPFDALDYAETIGMIFEIIACIIFVLAIYSAIEYIRRLMQDDLTQSPAAGNPDEYPEIIDINQPQEQINKEQTVQQTQQVSKEESLEDLRSLDNNYEDKK